MSERTGDHVVNVKVTREEVLSWLNSIPEESNEEDFIDELLAELKPLLGNISISRG